MTITNAFVKLQVGGIRVKNDHVGCFVTFLNCFAIEKMY